MIGRGALLTHTKPARLDVGLVNWVYVAAALVATLDVVVWYLASQQGAVLPAQGQDLATYRAAAESWLGGSGFYAPYQLVGPYDMAAQPILYPPSAIPLFAASTALPAWLWWAVPVGVLAWKVSEPAVSALIGPRLASSRLELAGDKDFYGHSTDTSRSHRPASWRIAPGSLGRILLVLALLAYPQTVSLIWAGNPVMWIAAFLALGFAPLVLLKPTLAPFALIGFRDRRWWVGLVVLAVLSLAFLPMWPDYLIVLLNARDGQGWLYAAGNVPLMVVGWLARR